MSFPNPQLNPPCPTSLAMAQIRHVCPGSMMPPSEQSWDPFSDRRIQPPKSTGATSLLRISTYSSRLLTPVIESAPVPIDNGAVGCGGGEVGGIATGGSVVGSMAAGGTVVGGITVGGTEVGKGKFVGAGGAAATVAATAVAALTGSCVGFVVAVGAAVLVGMAVGFLVAVSVGWAVAVALGMAVSVTVGSTLAVAGASVAPVSGSSARVATRSATSAVAASLSEEGEMTIVEQVVMKQQPTSRGTPNKANFPKGFVPLNFVNHHSRNLVKKDIVLFTLNALDTDSGDNTLSSIPYNPP